MKKKYMSNEDFAELKLSLEQAVAISRGEMTPARVTVRETPDVRQAREKLELPRAEFARMLGVSPRTVEGWEQGRRTPRGAAGVLLRLALSHPKIVRQALK
jgi:putative transcriptional regulator